MLKKRKVQAALVVAGLVVLNAVLEGFGLPHVPLDAITDLLNQ